MIVASKALTFREDAMPNKQLPEKLPMLIRSAVIERRVRAEDGADAEATYELSFSSDQPCERWWGVEILGHDKKEVDLSYAKKGLPLLDSHDLRSQIGIVENIRIEDGVARGEARFSKNARAQEVRQDIDDGIRRNVSVGYRVKKFKLVEENNGVSTYRATLWTPHEVSIVPVPADISVGVGRSDDPADAAVEFETGEEPDKEVRAMPDEVTPPPAGSGLAAPTPARAEPVSGTRAADQAEIIRLCNRHGLQDEAAGWIEQGLSLADAREKILEKIQTPVRSTPSAEQLDGLAKRDLRKYSYARAIQQVVDKGESGNFDGLEGEIHRELVKGLPADSPRHGGIMVPMRLGARTMDTLTAGKGTETVFDQPGELIEYLRNAAYVIAMGARTLTGLKGPVPFPRMEGDATVHWVSENPGTDVPDSDLAFGQVVLSPKTMMGNVPFSRQLLSQSTLDIEGIVRESLGAAHGLAIDRAALHGTGVSGQPMGIYNTADVQTLAIGGAPAYAKLVEMLGKVGDKNAVMGALGWLTTPILAAKMMATLEFSAAGARPIWTGPLDNGQVAGYRARATNQVSKTLGAGGNEHGLVFGNWATVLIGLWSSMELVVDPYSKKKQALIEVTSYQQGDVALRHPESICAGTGATA